MYAFLFTTSCLVHGSTDSSKKKLGNWWKLIRFKAINKCKCLYINFEINLIKRKTWLWFFVQIQFNTLRLLNKYNWVISLIVNFNIKNYSLKVISMNFISIILDWYITSLIYIYHYAFYFETNNYL